MKTRLALFAGWMGLHSCLMLGRLVCLLKMGELDRQRFELARIQVMDRSGYLLFSGLWRNSNAHLSTNGLKREAHLSNRLSDNTDLAQLIGTQTSFTSE